ncbi:MAG TPA: phosphoglucomutase [Flavobacteriales bacterium]|jgi:phosphoglucomutase|nr:phosphoglucomutase [Flavobacteriales bacterium]
MISNTSEVVQQAQKWCEAPFDAQTREETRKLIERGGEALEDAFYKDLEFGTGGMRGIMGVGTNRVNAYTLGMATQGLANYLHKKFKGEEISAAIAYDCRNNSDTFARVVADVLTANGIKVYLFESLRPTPELSFAVRYLNCQSGIVLTASHNPKEYNGYKVYWKDGAQVVPPHDNGIIEEVRKVQIEEVKFSGREELLEIIGEEIDHLFVSEALEQGFFEGDKSAISVAFTSLHGTSITLIPKLLKSAGFKNVHIVKEQEIPDGNFPTVESPNPEESAALKMAMELAEKTNSDLVIGTDPDADRIGIAVRNREGNLVLLNGNQTATLLTYYLLEMWKKDDLLSGNEFICQTIVTTDLLKDIADHFGVTTYTTLTGFKWIAEVIRKQEGSRKFIGGGEESFGFMIGDFVRDKDSVTSALIICEIAAWAKAKGATIYELLLDIYQKHGLYQEDLVSLVRKGKSGSEEIASMMEGFRKRPPHFIAGIDVMQIDDYQSGQSLKVKSNTIEEINLPSSNVIQFTLRDGSKITARPSGTEPKIKFYFSVKTKLGSVSQYDEKVSALKDQIAVLKAEIIPS